MNIPLMNRLISRGEFGKALEIVKEEIALPFFLGYICPGPCGKVCRRKSIDNPVSVCQLKKFVAAADRNNNEPYLPPKEKNSDKKVAIIGSGPAGLSCAFYLEQWGHDCVIIDRQKKAGGSLLDLTEDILPVKVLEEEIEVLEKYGVKWRLNTKISAKDIINKLTEEFHAIVIATGSADLINFRDGGFRISNSGISINKDTFETSVPGIFACGSVIKQQDMAVKSVAQGKAAATSVNQFLRGHSSAKVARMFNSKFGKLNAKEFPEYMSEAVDDDRITPGQGGLNGFTTEEAVQEAKRCMHCDCRKPDNCKLRIYSDKYGADRRKYLSGERKLIRKYFNHETIVYEPEKCIKCGLCIDIAREEKELTGLTFVGRGFNVKVDVPFNKTLEKALTKTAGKCAEACPTGAISLKNNM